jgi:hypothetical protein
MLVLATTNEIGIKTFLIHTQQQQKQKGWHERRMMATISSEHNEERN